MPDINKSVNLTNSKLKSIIDSKKREVAYNHNSWSDKELECVRSEIRNFYRKEQNFKCSYCKRGVSYVSASNAQVEHIVPKSLHLDFMFEEKNLCVICADCNEIKRKQETFSELPDTIVNVHLKRYPRASNSFKIIHPHFDIYDEHILITPEGYYVDKDSKKGRFTIDACRLNRKLNKKFGLCDCLTTNPNKIININKIYNKSRFIISDLLQLFK